MEYWLEVIIVMVTGCYGNSNVKIVHGRCHSDTVKHCRDGVNSVPLCFPGLRVQTRPKPLDISDVKILNMPSSGGEVKESVPCPSFAACKRT